MTEEVRINATTSVQISMISKQDKDQKNDEVRLKGESRQGRSSYLRKLSKTLYVQLNSRENICHLEDKS